LGGKTLFKRYLHERKAEPSAEDRFFKTADAGCLNDEGNLVIFGRTDGVFISGGENISPLEIENSLLRQNGIITAIVVPVPHREFGLTPWAFVETSVFFDEKKLISSLRTCLPGYKIPKRIINLSDDDKKGKMKYSREALVKLARSMAEGERDT
jgi:O-succinylbenzoic acid--CoA ligase